MDGDELASDSPITSGLTGSVMLWASPVKAEAKAGDDQHRVDVLLKSSQASWLADPPDVEIKLKENDAPTDHAWIIPLPMPGKTPPLAPKKHRTGGTTLAGLGKEFSGLWIGVFNADPSNERSYELTVTLRRKPPVEVKTEMKPPAQSPVAGKFFGRKK